LSEHDTQQDEILITRSRQGDLDAFNQLVLSYQDLVFSVILRMVRNHATAEDITQDAFIAAYKNIGRMRGVNFRAWVLRIARNATLDAIRRTGRRPEDSIDEQIVTLGVGRGVAGRLRRATRSRP
jgi:RNA polymerase sigma-70 factor (ECF subfamily)